MEYHHRRAAVEAHPTNPLRPVGFHVPMRLALCILIAALGCGGARGRAAGEPGKPVELASRKGPSSGAYS